jgi:hypothetical protein
MTATNGNGNGKAASLEEVRDQTRLARARARLAEANHEAKLWESYGVGQSLGWGDLVNPFYLRRDDFGTAWLPLGQGGPHARQGGRNSPFVINDADLDAQRALARWLATKNDLAIGALNTICNLTVKKGYEWEARPAKGYEKNPAAHQLAAKVQRVIDTHADVNGLAEREYESCWRAVRDGEVFTRHFDQGDGSTVVRFVLPEQVRDPGNFGEETSFGVRCEPDDVITPLEYCITYDGTDYDFAPAEEICHLKRNVDEEIKRGLSDFYSCGDGFDGIFKLLRNMRHNGAVMAGIAWIEEFEGATAAQIAAHQTALKDLNYPTVEDPVTGRTAETQHITPGKIIRVKKGKKYLPPPLAGNTTNFIEIVQACLRSIGVRWGFPEYFISGDASNNNYASILVTGSPLVNGIECQQARFGRLFQRWRWIAIRNACAAGLLPDFELVQRVIDLHYTPPQVAVANDGEMADVDHKDIAGGIMSKQTRAARRGLDWEQEKKFMAEEPPTRVAARAFDLDPQGNPVGGKGGAGTPPGGAAPPQPPPAAPARESLSESEQSRGQPGNAGQFGPGGGGDSGGAKKGKSPEEKARARAIAVAKATGQPIPDWAKAGGAPPEAAAAKPAAPAAPAAPAPAPAAKPAAAPAGGGAAMAGHPFEGKSPAQIKQALAANALANQQAEVRAGTRKAVDTNPHGYDRNSSPEKAAAVLGVLKDKLGVKQNMMAPPKLGAAYEAAAAAAPGLSVREFQDALFSLQQSGHVRLDSFTGSPGSMKDSDAPFAMPLDGESKLYVSGGPKVAEPHPGAKGVRESVAPGEPRKVRTRTVENIRRDEAGQLESFTERIEEFDA